MIITSYMLTSCRSPSHRAPPSVGPIHLYSTTEEIPQTVKEVTGKDLAAIRTEKGDLRQLVLELLYRAGGMKGP
jgi:hypothetical protein